MPPPKPTNIFRTGVASKPSSKPPPSSSSPGSKASNSTAVAPNAAANDDDEDDYMSLSFLDPSATSSSTSTKETSIQRIQRLKREAEVRGRPKSKAELAAEEKRKREELLSTSLITPSASSSFSSSTNPSSSTTNSGSGNKGLAMMQKMGFKIGSGLGKPLPQPQEKTDGSEEDKIEFEKRLTEPLRPIIKETRAGIGHDSELKRKFAETFSSSEENSKRVEISATDYRTRMNAENTSKRQEKQYHAAQKLCEGLTASSVDDNKGGMKGRERGDYNFHEIKKTPVVWRGLLYHRARREMDARLRHDVMVSGVSRISEKVGYTVDPEMESDDKVAFGLDGRDGKGRKIMEEGFDDDVEVKGLKEKNNGKISTEEVPLEEEWDDPELDEFEAKEPAEKLEEILKFMRKEWRYCFWCKSRYDDEAMEGCPGLNEEDHD